MATAAASFLSALGGSTGAGQELARAGASLENLRHSRDAELEADELTRAYLDELASFFETLNAYIETQALEAMHPDLEPGTTAGCQMLRYDPENFQ